MGSFSKATSRIAYGAAVVGAAFGWMYGSQYYEHGRHAALVTYAAQGPCEANPREVGVHLYNGSARTIERCDLIVQGFKKDLSRAPITGRNIKGCRTDGGIAPGQLVRMCFDVFDIPRNTRPDDFDWKVELREVKFKN